MVVRSASELRPLRYFLAVAEELHFGRAAARLHISQPSLSYAIRHLEESLGVELFTRTRRDVRLTDAGRLLLEEAPSAVAEVERALTRAGQAGRGELGELSVGFVPSAASSLVPACVRDYRASYPDVRLELKEMLDDPLLEAVAARQLDVAFVRTHRVSNSDLRFEAMLADRMCVVLRRDHRLARHEELSYADLAEEPFVLCSCARPRAEARDGFDKVVEGCIAAGFSPRIAQESSLPYTTLGLVDAGLGITVLSDLFRTLCPSDVVFVPLTGERGMVYLAWHAAELSVIRNNFVAVVRSVGERLGSDQPLAEADESLSTEVPVAAG
jgi:DNA-binding transcriptional LysR family regulator